MMRLLLFLTMLSALAVSAADAPDRTVVNCAVPPVIDGKLDDAAWTKAVKFDKFYRNNSTRPGLPTTALLLRDAENLYIAFRCTLAPGQKTVRCRAQENNKVIMDDSVEVMIDTNRTQDRYWQLIVNSAGRISAKRRGQAGSVGTAIDPTGFKAKGFVGPDFWSVEIQVPYSELEIKPEGEVWGFNFCRNNRNPDESSSVAEEGAFNRAAAFIPIGGFDVKAADRYAWQLDVRGCDVEPARHNSLDVKMHARAANLSSQPRAARAVFWLQTGRGEVKNSSVEVEFNPGEVKNIDFPALNVTTRGMAQATLTIEDRETRLRRRSLRQPLGIDFTPLELTLNVPRYRGTIFASQKLADVVVELANTLPADTPVTVGIRTADGRVIVSKELTGNGTFRFPNAKLPEGKMTIFATAEGVRTELPLLKLPFKPGEVWIDDAGFIRREGKRFWPIIDMGDGSMPYFDITISPYRHQKILSLNGFHAWGYPGIREARERAKLLPEDAENLRSYTVRDRDTRNLFAWFLVDEPDVRGIPYSGMRDTCNVIRENDPYHPIMVSTYGCGIEYFGTAELNGMHPYPTILRNVARNDFDMISNHLDDVASASSGNPRAPTMVYFSPGYNLGDCDRPGRRVHTFDETRTENLMAMIRGSRGNTFYVWTAHSYPELYIGNAEWVYEILALRDTVLVADDVKDAGIKVDNPKIRYLVKKVGPELWVLAYGASKGTEKATFTVPGLGNRKLQVLREGRSIQAADDQFSDSFTNFDARIFTTDTRDFGLRPLKDVEAEIEAVYTKRRKPGNLAYQRYEEDAVKVYASSNAYKAANNPHNALWHIADGVTEGVYAPEYHGQVGVLVWLDKTPFALPDWIDLEFPKPVTVGRVVVYPVDKMLKDYEVQALRDGKYVTLGKVKDATGKFQEVTFAPTSLSRLRVLVTATRGPTTGIREIEVYEK